MSRQDKATTDRHARTLRELVKQPDNKNCADCRKNDARWASWNLSMGTHISKVKSIDLDIWTPEQMENIKKWGNKRANLYWEKHLKAGHVPPDHKVESFIRSKYESRRWAMEGPPPSDPSVLESGGSSSSAPPQYAPTPTTSAPPAAPASLPRTHPLLSRTAAQPRPTPPAPAPAPMLDLFGDDPPSLGAPASTPATATAPARSTATSASAAFSGGPPATTAAVATPGPTATATSPAGQPQQQPQQSNIFDLDFRTPTPNSASSRPQTAKADIMSLFSTASPMVSPPIQSTQAAPAQSNAFASWNGGITSSAPPQQQQQQQNQSNLAGLGGWGMGEQNAWGSTGTSHANTNVNANNNNTTGISANGGGINANPWGGSGFGGAGAASGAGAGMAAGSGMSSGLSGMGGMGGMSGMGMSMGADPWSTPAPQQQQNQSQGHGGFGGVSAAQAKKAEHDPFANIWQ